MGVQSMFDLTGRVAVVTGGSQGLGLALAEAMAEAGARVVVAARRRERVDAAVEALKKLGTEAVGVVCDVRDPQSCQDLAKAAVDAFGSLDILINAAGTIDRTPAEDVTVENWRRVIETNLSGTFYASQAAARYMLKQGRGKIINIASATTFRGLPGRAAYSASKGGVGQLTRVLAAEWASRGIQVNAIAPGWFRTEINAQKFDDENWRRRLLERIPAGRPGVGADLKGAAIFLASPASDYVTGEILLVDGGYVFTDAL